VGIYDTRDVVVTELQMWLARRLLEVKEYEFEEDVSQIPIFALTHRSIPKLELIGLISIVCQGRNAQEAIWRYHAASL